MVAGTGFDYWSVDPNRGSALPLTTFAVNNALLEMGYIELAQQRIQWYLENDVYPDGSINMSKWSNCPYPYSYNGLFPDGLADYGQLLDLVINAARLGRNATFLNDVMPLALNVANYMLGVHNAGKAKFTRDDWQYGLIYGQAEHDTCHDLDYYVSTQVWYWRGLHEFGLLLQDPDFSFTTIDTSNSTAFLLAAQLIKSQLESRLPDASTYDNVTNLPVFVSPKLQAVTAPFGSMIQDTVSEYSNFRYWTETLLASGLPAAYEVAMLEFRDAHQGIVSGITRWNDHLDDMPSTGYGWSHLVHDRLDAFYALQYGHMANYMSPGVFSATEQLNYQGDHLNRLPLSGDGAEQERDLDFCIVSASLPALFTKWQLVITPRDSNVLHLAKAAPRRWLSDGFGIANATTRYGRVTYNVSSANAITHAHVSLTPAGSSCPDIVIRLQSATANPQPVTDVKVLGTDGMTLVKVEGNDVLFSCDCSTVARCEVEVEALFTST